MDGTGIKNDNKEKNHSISHTEIKIQGGYDVVIPCFDLLLSHYYGAMQRNSSHLILISQ